MATVIEEQVPDDVLPAEDGGKLVAVIGRFDTPEALVAASEKVRDRGYRRWDTYTPFPIHGLEHSMGVPPTKLPWIVLGMGILGCINGVLMQWHLNGYEFGNIPLTDIANPLTLLSGYEYIISGKPIWSFAANIPIAFELTIMFAAYTAFGAMLAMNFLSRPNTRLIEAFAEGAPPEVGIWSDPLFDVPGFEKSTDDKFFVSIESTDPKFEASAAKAMLSDLGASAVDEVRDAGERNLPAGLATVGLLVATFALLPPVAVSFTRASTWQTPEIHPVLDMDSQPKFKPQERNPFFADQRAMRPQVAGTVARNELETDTVKFAGVVDVAGAVSWSGGLPVVTVQDDGANPAEPDWTDEIPIEITETNMERGLERYEIFCAPCHGIDGQGQGLVNRRAMALTAKGKAAWQPAANLHQARLRNRENGYLFHVIGQGAGKMPGYSSQIPVEDRWAIVLYLRAMQFSRQAPADLVPADVLEQLDGGEES